MISKKIYKVSEYNKFCKRVELDDSTFFKISNKLFKFNNLKENMIIDNFDEILSKCIQPAIRHRLIDLLSKKDYSKKELLQKLYIYGYSKIYVEPLIDELIEKGYINDEEYCINLIISYSKKYGIHRIKNKLFEKGVEKDIISRCLDKVDLDSYNIILKYLHKYDYENLIDYKSKQKIFNKLLYRGFENQDINNAIEDRIFELCN